ncbi:hypothetical protein [Piscinibacter sp.]|jgi:hypothetical protein|uniref:hypothetical protein n=1 Tax=Piscinibacter sp. TaxID=1903157 RepID=UPI002F40D62B
MTLRFSKTDSGRAEISSRGGKLPRTARNLLLIIDGTRAASNWVELIHGATQADVDLLLDQGLIEAARVEASRPNAPTQTLEAAVAGLNYDQLYGLLTSQAKERLGLIKGFKMVLDVEKCSGLAELQTLAVRFVGLVREVQGDGAAKKMRLALGMAG